MASRATQVPLPSETPFVPSPTPSARDTLQSAQPQAFSFSSSLPINTINLSPGSDDSDLIAALVTANQSCSNHTVINLPAGQTYTLTSVNNTFFGGTGLPVIVCEVTINGDATQIIRGVGAPNFRIFGVNNPGILRLNGIEVRNGYAANTGGGGILNVFGGQVYLNNSVIANNVTNQTGSPQTLGAGIYSYQGTLYIENSRIANNLNLSLVGDGGGVGVIDAVTTIIGSDFADNGTTRDGGGIALLFTGLPSVNNSCITGNDRVNTSGLPLSSNGLFAGQGTTDATDNWWGASNGPSGPGLSGSGDFVYGNNISVNPFQTASIPCGPQPPVCPAGGTQSLSTNSACVTPTPTPTATPTSTPVLDCSGGVAELIPNYLANQVGFTQEAMDMGAVGNSAGLYIHDGPTLNSSRDNDEIPWDSNVIVDARVQFGTGANQQIWYRITYMGNEGWIAARIDDKVYIDGGDTCSSITTPTNISFGYDREAAANYAVEHSYQNNGLSNPLAGGRVTRRLANNQSSLLIPFANFTYSNITGVTGATGSAVFISESIWAGGVPMSVGSTMTCDVTAINEAGWCWESDTDPSNPWDKHEQIVAFFTDAQAPITISGYNVTNTQLSGSSSGIQLTGFNGTINSTYFSGNRDGDPPNNNDTFNTPDMDTDFINSIPTLRQGIVSNTSILDARVYPNLAGIQMGDYILIDPFDTGGGAHGVLVVGWGSITNCGTAIGNRYTISSFTQSRTSSNMVPFIADFTRAQSPVPRPFYCTMYNDQQSPVQGFFERHDWRFYTIANFISRTKDQLYIDPNWQWTTNDG